MQIVLFEPEIPPNTGNIARLCAATTTRLNLIEPLGFSIDDKHLRRAGLDYWKSVDVRVWPDMESFCAAEGLAPGLEGRQEASSPMTPRLILTSGKTPLPHHTFSFRPDDILVFGPETRGLPDHVLRLSPHKVRIPTWGCVRSLNLSTSAGIVLYEALRSCGELDSHC